MNEIQLNFAGPFTFVDGEGSVFKSRYVKSEGIYLWTIKQIIGRYHLIHYIGETKSLAKRQKEHLIHMLGFNYGIWDPDKLQNGISDLLWNGLWRNKNENGPALQLKAYEELSHVILKYVSVLNIFFAEINIEDNKRKHIEGIIGRNLRNNPPEYKSLYPDDNLTGIRKIKYNEKVLIKSSEEIKGIDSEIII